MAIEYQKHLSKKLVQGRTKKMNAGRKGKKVSDKASPKQDSRKEASQKLNVPVRAFREMKKLQDKAPTLYAKTVTRELETKAALKQMKKDAETARVTQVQELIAQPIEVQHKDLENQIHCADAVEVMRKVPDDAASLVLFSPWYHGVPIAYDPSLPERTYSEYLAYQKQLLIECFRASRCGGRLAIVVDNVRNTEGGRHFMLPLVSDFAQLAFDCGWGFFNELAWFKDEISGDKSNFGSLGLCSAPLLNRNHESILLFFKGTHKLEGDPKYVISPVMSI